MTSSRTQRLDEFCHTREVVLVMFAKNGTRPYVLGQASHADARGNWPEIKSVVLQRIYLGIPRKSCPRRLAAYQNPSSLI